MANFGDIPSSLVFTAGQVVRRNLANNGWETYTPTAGLTIGSTTISSGGSNRILYQNSGVVSESANFTYDGSRLSVIGTADTQQLIVEANSTQTANLVEFWNSAGNAVFTVDKLGTLKLRSRITGSDARIELSSGASPTIDLYGDVTNGYYPGINFYWPGGSNTGTITGYNGIFLNPGAGFSAGANSYYQNTAAWTAKTGYVGIHTVPLSRVSTVQGLDCVQIWQDGSIKQYGAVGSVNYGLPRPVLGSLTASGSGSGLAAGTYYYKVSSCNFAGESIGSNELSITITAGQNVTPSWTSSGEGADHYRVYRATTPGGYTGSSRIDTGVYGAVGVPYYALSLLDSGQAGTTGSPKTAIAGDTLTYRRWAGQSGAFINFLDESSAVSLAKIDFDGSLIGTKLRARYDGSNYADIIVSSAGAVTFDATGASASFTFADDVIMADAKNIAFNASTGTKIGTATSQKLAFWNATPIVQPTTAIAGATFVANAGTAINDASTFDGYTIKQLVKALRNMGAIA